MGLTGYALDDIEFKCEIYYLWVTPFIIYEIQVNFYVYEIAYAIIKIYKFKDTLNMNKILEEFQIGQHMQQPTSSNLLILSMIAISVYIIPMAIVLGFPPILTNNIGIANNIKFTFATLFAIYNIHSNMFTPNEISYAGIVASFLYSLPIILLPYVPGTIFINDRIRILFGSTLMLLSISLFLAVNLFAHIFGLSEYFATYPRSIFLFPIYAAIDINRL